MKLIQLLNPLMLFLGAMACANNDHSSKENNAEVKVASPVAVAIDDTFETGKIIAAVSCKNDASQSYALYIPAVGAGKVLPIIYFFDPHGSGVLPVTKYKSLAELFGFILAGSNNSKNGNDWGVTENIWNNMVNDSQKRFKIDNNRIYTGGFSGGAKVATYAALRHAEVKAVIANGAALPDITQAGYFPFSFTAITGEGDMNMTDLVAIEESLNGTSTTHRILYFAGKHEWAPEATMKKAFEGIELDAMNKKLAGADKSFINHFIEESKSSITAQLQKNEYIKAERDCRFSISALGGLTPDANWFRDKETSIKTSPVYKQQADARNSLLSAEEGRKNEFMQHFEKVDVNYWNKTVSNLQEKAKPATAEGAMNQRLLAYLSLAFYSISNQLINGNRNNEARYFVDLYKLVDPGNSEAWYFSALLNARDNKTKETENDLLKASANGFNDSGRMLQQPEFQQLHINLAAIEDKMKTNK